MSDSDLQRLISEFAAKFPPLITLGEAAEIARVPLKTIYDWSSRELFDTFKSQPGRRVLLVRDGFVRFVAQSPHLL